MSPLHATKNLPGRIFRAHPDILGWLLAVTIGLLGLWQFHIPQFASNFDKFPGDRGDARLVAYIMEHWYRVFQNLASWRSPAMFYPVEGTLGYADLMLGYGIVYSCFRTFGLGIFEAAEFTIILFNFLNYLVCFILLNKVLRFNLLASIAGAAFFAFNNPKLVQLAHPQLQPILFLPLAVIGIVLFVKKRDSLSQTRAFGLMALAALSLSLQLLTGFYPGWFFIFWSTLFLFLTLVFKETRTLVLDQLRRFWPALLAGFTVFSAALIPFVMAYWPIIRSVGGRPYVEIQRLIPVPWSFLVMGRRNYLWGEVSQAIQTRHPMSPELQIGIGLVPSVAWLVLVGLALWYLIRNLKGKVSLEPERRRNLLFLSQLIMATALVYLLGTRYWHDFSPWQFIYSFFPGAQVIRAVARYVLVLALPMAIAFAFLIHFLSGRIAQQKDAMRRTLLFPGLVFLTGFGLVEQFDSKEGFDGFSISAENKHLNRIAHSLPDGCSSFYVAVKPAAIHNQFEYQIDAVFVSIMKGVPTLNGYSGQLPQTWRLWELMDSGYENNVKLWIDEQRIKGNVCRLFINPTTASSDIADAEVFVRQQYLDILRREPDQSGLQTWVTKLKGCTRQGGRGSDKDCDRISVSLGILNSSEFLDRSYFVLRLYLAALGRLPRYEEFLADRESIVSASTADLDSSKEALVAGFVQQFEFKAIYDGLTNAEFVEKLLTTAANSSINRGSLAAALESRQRTRAQVLHTVIEDQQTVNAFRNQAFVLMQFFANLNRDPQPWEYEERLNTLNANEDYRQLVTDFLYSVEYRKRFGYVN